MNLEKTCYFITKSYNFKILVALIVYYEFYIKYFNAIIIYLNTNIEIFCFIKYLK